MLCIYGSETYSKDIKKEDIKSNHCRQQRLGGKTKWAKTHIERWQIW